MRKNKLQYLTSGLLALIITLSFVHPTFALAILDEGENPVNTNTAEPSTPQPGTPGGTYNFQAASGLDITGAKAGFAVNDSTNNVDSIIATVLSVGLSLVGILFFAYLIYGAYILMTSRGNDEKVKSATNTVTNAIIGLIVTLSAYVISNFLINYFWS